MKTSLMIASLVAALCSLPAIAQPGPGMGGQESGMSGAGPGMPSGARQGRRGPVDCSKTRNPEQCKARQEERQKTRELCKDKMGPAHKQCMQQNMPPVDCAKAPNPERCATHQQAREACKDKVGPEHRRCLRDKLAPKK